MIQNVLEVQPEPIAAGRRRSVLIIDDDESQSYALSWRLQNLGFETQTADLGRSGLLLAKSSLPDVVLLDLQLPDSDGLDICEQLSDNPVTCGIPVIIVSGSDQQDIVKRARAAGSEYFLRKPYDPNVVLMLVERAIERLRNEEW